LSIVLGWPRPTARHKTVIDHSQAKRATAGSPKPVIHRFVEP